MPTETPAYTILLSVRLTSLCPHRKPSNQCCGNAEWMRVIHEINRLAIADGLEVAFGEPTSTYSQSGGRFFEEYPRFRVVLGRAGDNANHVQAKDADAAEALRQAVLTVTGLEVEA